MPAFQADKFCNYGLVEITITDFFSEKQYTQLTENNNYVGVVVVVSKCICYITTDISVLTVFLIIVPFFFYFCGNMRSQHSAGQF